MTQSISHSGWNKLEWLCFCGIPSTPSNDTMLASVSPLYPQSLEVFLASPSSKSCCLLPASVWQLQREAACCLLLVTSKGEETMVWARCLLQEATCCLLPVKSRGEETMGWAWCLLQKATCCLLPVMSWGEKTMKNGFCPTVKCTYKNVAYWVLHFQN